MHDRTTAAKIIFDTTWKLYLN